jgi:hypothetical protein
MNVKNGPTEFITLVESTSMASDFNSIAQDTRFYQLGCMQIKYQNNDASNGIFIPQASVDLVNWCDLIDKSDCAISELGKNNAFYAFDIAPFPYIRLAYEKGSNSSGSFSVITFWKKLGG